MFPLRELYVPVCRPAREQGPHRERPAPRGFVVVTDALPVMLLHGARRRRVPQVPERAVQPGVPADERVEDRLDRMVFAAPGTEMPGQPVRQRFELGAAYDEQTATRRSDIGI